MKRKIKICGLKALDNVIEAHKHGAHWYGLIFYKKSPRNISLKDARFIVKNSPHNIKPVAVTVDSSLRQIENIVNTGVNTIQLHGNETIEYCNSLKANFGVTLIKSIGVKTVSDLKLVKSYNKFVDWLLFDSKGGYMPGGTGKSFRWEIVNSFRKEKKWILSGGLSISNIKEAIDITNAPALDVSSGVESKLGVKSKKLIKSFCNLVKDYNGE